MQIQEQLWIYVFTSLICLSLVCANQRSIVGGSVPGSRSPSSTLTGPGSTTNIQSSSLVKTPPTPSLQPSFSSETLTSLTKLTALTTNSITTTNVKGSVDSSETTSSCWFCHLLYKSSTTSTTSSKVETTSCWFCDLNLFTITSSSNTQNISQTKQIVSDIHQSASPSANSATHLASVHRTSVTPSSVISTSVITDSSRLVSSNFTQSSSTSCWFCHLYSTPSVTHSSATSKDPFLNIEDLISQLFKSTVSQTHSESYIKLTSTIVTTSSAVYSISPTSSLTASSMYNNSVFTVGSALHSSTEASTSSCWFCHLYSTPSVSLISSSPKNSFLNMDDLISQLFKSTSESHIKSSSIIQTTPFAVKSISSTPTQALLSSVINDRVFSTSSVSPALTAASTSSCWYCHLYSSPTTFSSVTKTTRFLIDDLISQLFSSTASQNPSGSNIKSTSTLDIVSPAKSIIQTTPSAVNSISSTPTLTLFSAKSIGDHVFSTSSVSPTFTAASTSSCWYCHLYSTPTTTLSTVSKTTRFLIDDLISQLFTSTTSQNPSGSNIKSTSTLNIVSASKSNILETTSPVFHTSTTNDLFTNVSKLSSTYSTDNVVTSSILTKSPFSTNYLLPSFKSLGSPSSTEATPSSNKISGQPTETQSMSIISTDSMLNNFSSSISAMPNNLSGKSFSTTHISTRKHVSTSQTPHTSSPEMLQSSSQQSSQSSSLKMPQSSSLPTFQRSSPQTSQSSSLKLSQSSFLPTLQSSSEQLPQSTTQKLSQRSSSTTLQSSSQSSSLKMSQSSSSLPIIQSSSNQTPQRSAPEATKMSFQQTSYSHTYQSSTPSSLMQQSISPTLQSSSQHMTLSNSLNLPQNSSFTSSFHQTQQSSSHQMPTIQRSTQQIPHSSYSHFHYSSSSKIPQNSSPQTLQSSALLTPISSFTQAPQRSSPATQPESSTQTLQKLPSQSLQMSTSQTPQSRLVQTHQSNFSQTLTSSLSQAQKSHSLQTPQDLPSLSTQMLQSSTAQTSLSIFQDNSQNASSQLDHSNDSPLPKISSSQAVTQTFSQTLKSSYSQTLHSTTLSSHFMFSQAQSKTHIFQSSYSDSLRNNSSKMHESVFSKVPQNSSLFALTSVFSKNVQSTFSQNMQSSSIQSTLQSPLRSQSIMTSLYFTFNSRSSSMASFKETPSHLSSEDLTKSLESTKTLMSSLIFTDLPTASSMQSVSTFSSILPLKLQSYSDTVAKATASVLTTISETTPTSSNNTRDSNMKPTVLSSSTVLYTTPLYTETASSASTESVNNISQVINGSASSFGATPSKTLVSSLKSSSTISTSVTHPTLSITTSQLNVNTMSNTVAIGTTTISPIDSVTISESPIMTSSSLMSGIPSPTTLTSNIGLVSISPTPASASINVNSTMTKIVTTIASKNVTQMNTTFTPSLNVSGTALWSSKLSETVSGMSANTTTTTRSVKVDSIESTPISSTSTSSYGMGLSENTSSDSEIHLTSTTISHGADVKESSQTKSIFNILSSQFTEAVTQWTAVESRTSVDSTITLTSSLIATNTYFSRPSLSSSSQKFNSSHMLLTSSPVSLNVISASQNVSGNAPSSTSTASLTLDKSTVEPLTSTMTTTSSSLAHSTRFDIWSDSKNFTIPKPLNTVGTKFTSYSLETSSTNQLSPMKSLKPSQSTVTTSGGQSDLFGKSVSSPSFTFPKPLHTVGTVSATTIPQTSDILSPSQTSSATSITVSGFLQTKGTSSTITIPEPSSLVPTALVSSDLVSSTPLPLTSSIQHLSSTVLDTSTSPIIPASSVSLLPSASLTTSIPSLPTSTVKSTTDNVEKSTSRISESQSTISAHLKSTSTPISMTTDTLSGSAFVDSTPLSVAMSTSTSSRSISTSTPSESTMQSVTVLSSSSSGSIRTTLPLESPSSLSTPITTSALSTPEPSTTEASVSSTMFSTLISSTIETPVSTVVLSTSSQSLQSSAGNVLSSALTASSTVTSTSSTVVPTSKPTAVVTPASSAVLSTTPLTVVNATNAGEEYWLETGIRENLVADAEKVHRKVQVGKDQEKAQSEKDSHSKNRVLKILQSVDVSTKAFRDDMENRFAIVYKEGFKRLEGKSDSILKRKRRKRYTQVGDAAVHIQHITRTPNTTTVSVAYTVEKSGTLLEPQAAIDALTTLDTQELAIILRQVVDVTAEPYIKMVTLAPSSEDDALGKLWIIGAVAGPVLAIILIVWLVLCIYLKCCRTIPEKHDEEGEPRLTSIKNTETQKITQFSKAYDNQGYSELPEQSSRQGDKKARSYEVNPEPEAEYIETFKKMEVTPLTNAEIPKQQPSVGIQNGTTIKDKAVTEGGMGGTPQKKKKTKRNGSIEPLGPGSSDNSPRLKSNSEKSFLLHSSISGEDEELKGKTQKERQKNKERLREKQQKKKDDDVRAYLEAQREIDKVLGVPNGLPDVFVENSDGSNHTKVSRQDSGVSNEPLSGEETLEEARMKMHQLLDDAFTLISPRQSLQENDLRAIQRMQAIARRHGDKISTSSPERNKIGSVSDNKSKVSTVHLDSTKDLGHHIKHEPMHFDSGYSHKGFPLETWSPYRASDQVALISMPNTMETKLDGSKSKNKEKERPTTSRPSRRPAANFETQDSKSTGYLDQKYASSSPQPIVLRSKDLASFVNTNKDKQSKESVKTRQNSLGKYAAMTSLNGDVYLSGSTTTLPKKKDKGLSRGASSEHTDKGLLHSTSSERSDKDISIGEGIELRKLKRKSWADLQKHRGPVPHQKDSDEVDVINNIEPAETSGDLIKSLRDELQLLKSSYVDPKSSKKGKTGSGMTEIV